MARALNDPVPRFGDCRRLRIGLLGGSFNPAHAGHLHVARTALARLALDQVWLLVSPGNPLKPSAGMASLEVRLASARAIADGRRILATGIERHFSSRSTIDTLGDLKRLFPRARFVWLMGADNLAQFPQWRRWRAIARMVPFAVLPRPTYTHRALAGRAAHALRHARRGARRAPALAELPVPAWILLTVRQDATSATALRTARGDDTSPGSPPHPPRPDPATPSARRPSPR